MTNAVQWIGMVASGLAAACFLRSTFITVPDNIDTMVGEMQRAGRWNAVATALACVAFICQAYLFGVDRLASP